MTNNSSNVRYCSSPSLFYSEGSKKVSFLWNCKIVQFNVKFIVTILCFSFCRFLFITYLLKLLPDIKNVRIVVLINNNNSKLLPAVDNVCGTSIFISIQVYFHQTIAFLLNKERIVPQAINGYNSFWRYTPNLTALKWSE